jgi:Tfp pilus assembly protein PilN
VLIVVLAWVGALVAALLVLGFCAYELAWKLRRLRRDALTLQTTTAELKTMQVQLRLAQERVALLRTRSAAQG